MSTNSAINPEDYHLENYGFSWESTDDLDLDLYSRQFFVLGGETMRKLAKFQVLVIGATGLGVEVAKNTILAGPKGLTVYDNTPTAWTDLASQFYLTEEDIGKPRGAACVPKLAELNPHTDVNVYEGELTKEFVQGFSCVVLCESNDEKQACEWNSWCHEASIPFIAAQTRGLSGYVFCDFGPEFTVIDKNGEEEQNGYIVSISPEGLVTCNDDERHGLSDDSGVVFREVQGFTGLNDGEIRKIRVETPFSFQILDFAEEGEYLGGGIWEEKKLPEVMKFNDLATEIINPGELMLTDFAKWSRAGELHVLYRGLAAYQAAHDGQLPPPNDMAAAEEVYNLAKAWNAEQKAAGNFSIDGFLEEEGQEKIWQNFALYAQGNLNPMAAFFGGIVGQEVIKTSAGKFGPVHQWLYFDAFECLPDERITDENDFALEGTRYDGQIAVFGKAFQQKLLQQKIFMVGCGALGCEFFKNFAMMGLGASDDGKIYVTDMDTIERSNLNRQFLFREHNIGQLKSEAASEAVGAMNPNIQVETYKIPVGKDTEDVFDDAFWNNLSNVVNALDSVTARKYVDARCVYYRKSLLESGTLGTMANVQVVLANKSESYGSTEDPAGKSIPMCTLKNFPNQIEHCIEWARDRFTGLFRSQFEQTEQYLKGGDKFLADLPRIAKHPVVVRETLENITNILSESQDISFEKCIEWARIQFQEMYYNNAVQLLHNFPKDATNDDGSPFWGGPKRAPEPVVFNSEDELHIGFIIAAANVRASSFGLEVPKEAATDKAYIISVLEKVEVPEFVPRTNVKIHTDDKEAAEDLGGEEDEEKSARLTKEMPPVSDFEQLKLDPAHFEKDDDTNFHIDFITACSNLRARNYVILEADRQRTKKIAGRIIPAIATTTAMITGMVMLEQYKLVQGHNELEYFRNGYINLGVPTFQLSETVKAFTFTAKNPDAKNPATEQDKPDRTWPEEGYNLWDRIDVDGDLTVAEFQQHFNDVYKMDADSITYQGDGKLVPLFMFGKKFKDRKDRKITDLLKEFAELEFGEKQNTVKLDVVCSAEDGELDVGIPPVVLHFKA